ncbi:MULTISPECIES: hypothetical protein [Sphingobium]|uniref:DUF4376 domain-containing protein n=1 Tax=Sphingobium TaxID=165695 RepID=UPI0015EB5825|nr:MULTISPECIES: hypothetical protein [Sphingobium]MCW2361608.1 hypothetical protein [Sphingobium sp. B10D3B]MCW2401713.1 hypothetical protein [Sphingobium sp. B10D7B]MCW2408692.1 hypothetical protein [Sphingobium xanthum]
MTPEREFWLVWSDASGSVVSKGHGISGDFGSQQFTDGLKGVPVDQSAWIKNANWTAEDVRDALLAQLSRQFALEVEAGCPSPLGRICCDDQAQSRVDSTLRYLNGAIRRGEPVPSVNWTMWDRSQVPHSLTELEDMGYAMDRGFQAKMAVRQAKEAALRDPGASFTALMAIDIFVGWPPSE